MEYVAIDFEKLNDSQLSVCEVGLVFFKDGKEVGSPYHSYINPVGELNRNDWAKRNLSHISDEMLFEAPSYDKLFPILQQKIQDKILVAHSKGADLNYIYHLEEHYNLPKLYSKWIDTKEIAQYLEKDVNLLGLYLQLFGKQFIDHHKALEDARACGQILERLSSLVDINQFIHHIEYLPSEKKQGYDDLNTRHTQYGTSNVTVDGLVFNHDKITSSSFFQDKTVVLSGMTTNEKNEIKYALGRLGAKCSSGLSRKTNVFITSGVVGPSKKLQAIKLQNETGLLVITDKYFWNLTQEVK